MSAFSSDPRFVAAQRLRAKGRHEAAVQMLSDLLLAATEGKSEEEQMSFDLAPLYYEYGSALASLARAEPPPPPSNEEDERSTKRLRVDEADQEDAEKEEEADEEEDEDDGLLAWKLLDQARCIYEAKVEDDDCEKSLRELSRSELARCCVQLGDLDSDGEQWGDAIVEYTSCVEQYEARGAPYSIDDEKRFIGALVGAANAYLKTEKGRDVTVGDGILVAPGDECEERAKGLVAAAEKRLNGLLTTQASKEGDGDFAKKTDLCSIVVEVQAAKDLLLQYAGDS